MVIYGWDTKAIKRAPMPEYECPHCHQKQSELIVRAHYVHLFWIPVFPYKKTAVIACKNCKYLEEEHLITAGTNISIKQLKAALPVPKYLFAGLALIVVGIGYLIYENNENAERRTAFVLEPKVGDVVPDEDERRHSPV